MHISPFDPAEMATRKFLQRGYYTTKLLNLITYYAHRLSRYAFDSAMKCLDDILSREMVLALALTPMAGKLLSPSVSSCLNG